MNPWIIGIACGCLLGIIVCTAVSVAMSRIARDTLADLGDCYDHDD